MTLNIDTASPLRALPRLEELVRAVRDAPQSTQEQPFVEWKREGNAADKKWRAELSKQVLGMANRDPDAAASWFGGCAYLLLGVSPGSLDGTAVHDAAKVESWLAPYVGRTPDGPEWIGTYVEVDGTPVLVITIEPPKWGDPIWTCKRAYVPDPALPGHAASVSLREGAIYVRHKASTEEHTAADLAMLQRRLLGSARRLSGISVLLSATSIGQPLDATEESIDAWIERERDACEPPPPSPPEETRVTVQTEALDPNTSLTQTAKMIADISRSARSAASLSGSTLGVGMVKPDRRTREQYGAEVDGYLKRARKALPGVIVKRAHEKELGLISFSIHNETDQPIQSLLLEIVIALPGVMAVAAWDADLDEAKMPDRPIMLGEDTYSPFDNLVRMVRAPVALSRPGLDVASVASRGPRLSIDNSSSARLTFDDIDLYPEETVGLPDAYLYVNADLHAGRTLTAQWSARARNLSGVMRGSIDIAVAPIVPTIDDLLADDERPNATEDDE